HEACTKPKRCPESRPESYTRPQSHVISPASDTRAFPPVPPTTTRKRLREAVNPVRFQRAPPTPAPVARPTQFGASQPVPSTPTKAGDGGSSLIQPPTVTSKLVSSASR